MAKKYEKISKRLSDEFEPKSRATRVRMLLKKNQRVFRDKRLMTDFKEPVAMLIRRGRAVEFYEDASKGSFIFKHSDGKTREIYLEPSSQVSFDYGKRKFKGYILHEDYPLPLPEIPLITADTFNMIVEKSMMDLKKLNTREKELQLKTIKVLIWLVIALGGLYMAYKANIVDRIIGMFTGNNNNPQQTAQAVNQIADNTLQIASDFIWAMGLRFKVFKKEVKKKIGKNIHSL